MQFLFHHEKFALISISNFLSLFYYHSNHARKPSKKKEKGAFLPSTDSTSILSKTRQNTTVTNPLDEHKNQSNKEPLNNKFNSNRTTRSTSRTRTTSES